MLKNLAVRHAEHMQVIPCDPRYSRYTCAMVSWVLGSMTGDLCTSHIQCTVSF